MKNKLADALQWIVSILRKHDVPFQIAGGFAANIYGAKRPVNDIDMDVPEDKMELLLPDVEQYITFGPAQYKDEKWDVQLMTLNFNGQEIDMSGAFGIKIFDERNRIWVPCPAQFETAQTHTVFGIEVPVMRPHDLIEYKKLLPGEHQEADIAAVQEYIAKNA